MTHIFLAVLGWYLLWQTERWSVPKAHSGTVPLKTGLRTLALGMPVLQVWAFLAGGAPHLEDGLTLLTFVLATRAVGQGRSTRAAIVVGLTAAWKPWGVVALPLLWGLHDKRRALFIGLAIPAACWLPFLLADQSTLHAVSYGFPLQPNSTLRVLGLGASTFRPGGVLSNWLERCAPQALPRFAVVGESPSLQDAPRVCYSIQVDSTTTLQG